MSAGVMDLECVCGTFSPLIRSADFIVIITYLSKDEFIACFAFETGSKKRKSKIGQHSRLAYLKTQLIHYENETNCQAYSYFRSSPCAIIC